MFRITGTQMSRTEDIAGRQTRYLISMGIRTGCFLGAILTEGWLRWVLFVGAIVLPYISVIVANAGRESPEPVPLTVTHLDRPALPVGPSQPHHPAS